MSQTQIGLELRMAKGSAIAPPLLCLIEAPMKFAVKSFMYSVRSDFSVNFI